MGISSPVLGLRPGRWFLSRRSKLPKPESFTCEPVESASRTSSKNRSTSSRASRLFRPSWSNKASAISALVRAMLLPYFRVQLGVEVRGYGSHQGIRFVVLKRPIIILKNQSQSDAFSSWFYASALVEIEHAQIAQLTPRGNTNTTQDCA